MRLMDYSANALRDEIMRKSDLCADALREMRRMSSAALFCATHAQLRARIDDLLEELDEMLVGVDHRGDLAAFERVAALHAGYEELEVRRQSLGT